MPKIVTYTLLIMNCAWLCTFDFQYSSLLGVESDSPSKGFGCATVRQTSPYGYRINSYSFSLCLLKSETWRNIAWLARFDLVSQFPQTIFTINSCLFLPKPDILTIYIYLFAIVGVRFWRMFKMYTCTVKLEIFELDQYLIACIVLWRSNLW